ncbi:MAG: phosphotransferase family protein [Candidatus Helarchaeota archaeon]
MILKNQINIDFKIIEKIIHKYKPLLKLISFHKFSEGISNLNLKIQCKDNKQIINYVLRICNPMFENWKFKKEYALLKYLHDSTNIPVPNVLFIDGSKSIIPFKYFITEYIPGKSLEELFPSLDFKCLKTIFSELGHYLSQLHKIKFQKFGGIEFEKGNLSVGPLRDGGYCDGPFSSWKESILSLYSYYLNKILDIKPFSDLVDLCKKYLNINIDLVECKSPNFIHKNLYEMSNTIINNNHISGLIDFEWAEAAHNEYELTQILTMINSLNSHINKIELWNSFLSQYKIPLSPNFKINSHFYSFLEIIHFMNVWDFIKNKYPLKNQIEIIKKTRQTVLDLINYVL